MMKKRIVMPAFMLIQVPERGPRAPGWPDGRPPGSLIHLHHRSRLCKSYRGAKVWFIEKSVFEAVRLN